VLPEAQPARERGSVELAGDAGRVDRGALRQRHDRDDRSDVAAVAVDRRDLTVRLVRLTAGQGELLGEGVYGRLDRGEGRDIVSEIEAPSGDWKTAMRQRVLSAREILLRHRWAPGVMESRKFVTPAMSRYFDSMIGLFREAGFSTDLTHHSMHALGSRALGFTQELWDDKQVPSSPEEMAVLIQQTAAEYPNSSAMLKEITHDADTTLGWCDDQVEFEFALDLILDGLDRLRQTT
jgi:Tetracyclin repressor-like, C-terminal domain